MAAATAEPTLFDRLRKAIWPLHHRVDHHPLLAPLTRDDLTHAQYLAALRLLHRFHTPLQPILAAAVACHAPELPFPSDRVAWLEADLAHWRIEPPPPAGDWDGLPAADAPELFGMLYVVEGSTLGGQYLLPDLRRRLGLGGDDGVRFFAGHGAATAGRWQQLRAEMTLRCPPATWPRVEAQACALFAALVALLDSAAGEYR